MSQETPPPPGSGPPEIPTANFAPPDVPPYPPGPLGYGDYNLSPRLRTSGMAVTSFILGLIWCIPILTGIAAIIFGIFGIRATRSPAVKGRMLAVTGLILGIMSTFGWGLMAFETYTAFWPQHVLVDHFFADLSSGDVAGAQKLCGPTVTTAQLDALATQLKSWGTVTSNGWSANSSSTKGGTLDVMRTFTAGGPQIFHFILSHNGARNWQIDSFTSSSMFVTTTHPTIMPTTLP